MSDPLEQEVKKSQRDMVLNLQRRKMAYCKTFGGPVAEEVLADLKKFCRADVSTFHSDARVSAMLEGRREVYLRIMQHLTLNSEELSKLYRGLPIKD